MTPLPNRVAVYLTAAAALLGALAPVVANLDFESVAGIAAGLAAFSAVVYKWLDGWQKWTHDERVDLLLLEDEELDDEFDEATAEPIPEAVTRAAQGEPGKARPR